MTINLQSEHAESLKECHVMYVVVHNGEHYVGGTEGGLQFVKQSGAYIPYSFLGYLSAKQSGEMSNGKFMSMMICNCTYLGYVGVPTEQRGSCDKNNLRKSVESVFNDLFSKHYW